MFFPLIWHRSSPPAIVAGATSRPRGPVGIRPPLAPEQSTVHGQGIHGRSPGEISDLVFIRQPAREPEVAVATSMHRSLRHGTRHAVQGFAFGICPCLFSRHGWQKPTRRVTPMQRTDRRRFR
jgi:hypothetical protein